MLGNGHWQKLNSNGIAKDDSKNIHRYKKKNYFPTKSCLLVVLVKVASFSLGLTLAR